MDFNEQSEKPRFIYKHNPLAQRSFQIFEHQDSKNTYEPVGDYTLLNTSEAPEITEKKVINLLSLMNGRRKLIDFSHLTKERVLYNVLPEASESDKQKIIFRAYNGQNVSTQNAVLTIEKGVFNDEQRNKTW